jgi:hypothetical protein
MLTKDKARRIAMNMARHTTARYARVATGMIAGIASPLDLLLQPRKRRKNRKDPPPA